MCLWIGLDGINLSNDYSLKNSSSHFFFRLYITRQSKKLKKKSINQSNQSALFKRFQNRIRILLGNCTEYLYIYFYFKISIIRYNTFFPSSVVIYESRVIERFIVENNVLKLRRYWSLHFFSGPVFNTFTHHSKVKMLLCPNYTFISSFRIFRY